MLTTNSAPFVFKKLSSVLCVNLDGWDGGGGGRDIHTVDSLPCAAETNVTL